MRYFAGCLAGGKVIPGRRKYNILAYPKVPIRSEEIIRWVVKFIAQSFARYPCDIQLGTQLG